jgi:methionyl-tRNA formyltransferase
MRVVFMGTPEAAVPALKKILEDGHDVVAVWTQPDRPSGRGNKLTAPPVKEFALARNIEVHQPAKIKTEEAHQLFMSYDADVAVVVAYGRILPLQLLSAPKRGCINVHFSLLPKYRGAAPVNWAVVNGEEVTGVTTMLMDQGLDTGDVLLQKERAIGSEETAPKLMARLAEDGAELLSETLKKLDEIEPRKQDNEKASFAPILKREDGLIDWALDADRIANRVRGFQPWPNAYTTYQEKRLVVWRASSLVVSSGPARHECGEVVEAQGNSITVQCGGTTALLLHEVQLEGKRRMSARDFINGAHVKVGEKLG